jgi:serine/threonine-protein kinase RsbW
LDTVALSIPASPAYLQVVRLIAAGLGTRIGFTLDEIEDLKIAVDELSAYLTGAQGRDGDLEISFEVGDDRLTITGVGHFKPGQKVRTELTGLSKMILQTVVDEAALDMHDGTPSFRLAKTKSA